MRAHRSGAGLRSDTAGTEVRFLVGALSTVKLMVDSIPATNGTRVRLPDGALDVSNSRPKTRIGGAA